MKQIAGCAMLLAATAAGQPVSLTQGPDTEAAWSPDGRQIAFQRERNGDADLLVLDVATGRERPLVSGPGDARYPAWSPDGRTIAYSFGHITSTAHQGIPNGYNLFAVPATGGEPRRLTRGPVRDYTPAFSPDGSELLFATTRDLSQNNAALGILRPDTGEVRSLIRCAATNMGAVSPAVSPDGRFLAYAAMTGLKANWRVAMCRLAEPSVCALITPPAAAMYAPRWSPDGTRIACTGYRKGDPGWGLYLLRLADGALARLDTGAGNARSPAWSPDGKSLVYEGNAAGVYRLYRLEVGEPVFEQAPEAVSVEPATVLLNLGKGAAGVDRIPDQSGRGHHAAIQGTMPLSSDGGIQCGEGSAQIAGHPDFAFGRGAFFVRTEVFLEAHPKRLQLIVVGDYPGHRLGWQVFVNAEGRACFNSRGPAGEFVGAMTEQPLPTGRRVTLLGVRDAQGEVILFVDQGEQPAAQGSGATLSYGTPTQIRVGAQVGGGDRFAGRIYRLEAGRGVPGERRRSMLTLKEVMGQ